MNSAQTPLPARGSQGSGLQFSIRSLLLLTACSAVAIWLWPMERDDPIEFQILLAFLVTAFLTTLFLTPAAWRRMAERKRSGIEAREHRFERFAFISGVLGMVPNGSLLLMVYLDPIEHGRRAVHSIMVAAYVTSHYSWFPIMVLLLGSLFLFFGFRRNFPLLLMRSIGVIASFVVVLVHLVLLGKSAG